MARLSRKLAKPRGIVHGPGRGQPERGPIELVRFEPPADLDDLVEHLWIVRWNLDEPQTETTLSHPSVHWTVEGSESEILGVVSGGFTRTLDGVGRVVAAKFRPGGFCAFYDRPLVTLTDERLPAAQLFGPRGRRVARSIVGLADPDAAEQLCEVLRAHGPRRDPLAQQAREIVEGIAADAALVSVDAVCKRFRTQPLALQRLFRAKIGVTPKWVIQRYRMHEAMERIAERAASGSRGISFVGIALELGFTDQAHFCRVFKRFIGESPGGFLRRLAARGTTAASS
jgi:AraC-like DNA-binding protein